ncbi:MAG TPA: PAS domain S-box protein [Desulfuromonadales bacterium]|nr:PAS domain S-box protein [Desulfuromonadales bacterium]
MGNRPPTHRKVSIKTKVTLTAFVMVSVLLAALSGTMLSYFHSLFSRNILQQQFLLVSEIAEQLNGRIELARHQLTLAATDLNSSVLSNRAELERILTSASPASMIFDAGFLVIGRDGHVLAESGSFTDLVGTDLNFRDYVSEPLKNGMFYISKPFSQIMEPRSPLIAMVVPVRDDHDRIICLLAGFHMLGADQFLTTLSSKRIGSSAYLYLLQGRTLLMHPDSARILEAIPEGKNRGIDAALKGFEGSLDNVNSKGQHMLSSFKRVGQTGWILGANIPYDEAFKPLRALAYNALVIALLGIAVSLGVVWLVTRRLTQPLLRLTDHLGSAVSAEGEWIPLVVHTGDEIEHLAATFNTTMKEVHDYRQALGEEKIFVENLINSASTPLFVINKDHHVLYWNRSLERITGIRCNDVIGTDWHWTGFYGEPRTTLADMILTGSSFTGNLYHTFTKSKYIAGGLQAEGWFEIGGARRYLVFEAAPIHDSSGQIVAAIETFEDISDRIHMEDSLLRLSRAVEQSPATIVITNLEGSIEYVNPKFCQVTGYTAEEVIGKNPRVLKSGEMSTGNYESLWSTVTSGKEWRGEFHNKRKDGSLFWEFASISPLYDKNSVMVGFLAVKEDITARKQVEAELQLSRRDLEVKHEQLASLFQQVELGKREWEETLDHLHDLIILTDSEHRIRRYNRLLADITGCAINKLVGLDWRELLQAEGFQCETFVGSSGEVRHERTGRSYDINIYSIVHDDVLEGHVISLNDTTDLRAVTRDLQKAYAELKAAQLQIFQQEKMASIGQLAAGVAHEINNPMGFISSNLTSLNKYIDRLAEFIAASDESLLSCAGSADAEKLKALRKKLKIDYVMNDARQLIAESQDGAGRVRRIVQDLKSFSRVDHAESALIDLNEALETTINIAWNEIKYVATLTREFGEIPPIKCFPQQLNQVFLNLLVNAAHALGNTQGSITVRTWCEHDTVFVAVTDDGCGIVAENLQRIFEPFFTTKEVGKGTGLGLSISYEIIRKHGGEITVTSVVGKGSTFTVSLPVAGPPKADETQEPEAEVQR